MYRHSHSQAYWFLFRFQPFCHRTWQKIQDFWLPTETCELGSPSCFFFRSLHSPCWDEGTTNFTSLKISLLNKNLLLSWWIYDVACENSRFSSLFTAGDVCSRKLRGTVILFNELKLFLSLNCFNIDHLLLNVSRPRLVTSLWQDLVTAPIILT